jgi:hypothetical protein
MSESIKHDDGPRVWLRKHDYMPEGYTIMDVTLLLDGTYEGHAAISHRTRIITPFTAKTLTLKECSNKLDQKFWELIPDHQCGSGCFDWTTHKTIFGEPPGRVQ